MIGRRILALATALALAVPAPALAQFGPGDPAIFSGTLTGTYTLGGTPTLNATLAAGASGFLSLGLMPYQSDSINQNNVTVTAQGTGYQLGDTITGQCTGCTFSTAPAVAGADLAAASATVTAGGTTGVNGACTVTDNSNITGIGYVTRAQFTGTVSGNALTGPLTIAVPGDYQMNGAVAPPLIPTNPIPVTGCSLTGATVTVTYSALNVRSNNAGVATAVPAKTATVTQASSSGSGTGLQVSVSFIPQAVGTINDAALVNGGSTVLGAETPIAQFVANESTFFGDRAGGKAIGGFNSAFGHNALGIGGACTYNLTTSSSAFGADAGRNWCGGNNSTALGAGALKNYSQSSFFAANLTAVGKDSMLNLNSASGVNNTALGATSCQGASGSQSFNNGNCFGQATGGALTSAAKFILFGQGVGNATCASGSDFALIDTGNNSLDCPAAGSSHFLNVAKVIAGDTAGATNPAVCAVGMKCVIGVLRAANFDVTTDQSITIRPLTSTDTGFISAATKYFITDIYVANCSASLTTAKGALYTAASKGGTIIGATTTPFTNCTGATAAQRLTGLTNQDSTVFSAATLFLSLTTAQGTAATGDVYIIGELVN